MGNPSGASSAIPAEERLNVYALVIYVPDPLGRFLDDLRRELVPAYNPHAHVSVLPPRPLRGDDRAAAERVRALMSGWRPFNVELTTLQVFPVTDVLYLEVGAGDSELRRMHAAMNTGPLEFHEPFAYHPHVTVAQEVPHDEVVSLAEAARRRWQEYKGARTFRADRAVFVQNTKQNVWLDLAGFSLGEQ